jgi:hypothetical protein
LTVKVLNVSKRVFLTLPEAIYEKLERWAQAERRKAATLAGFIVEAAVREAEEAGKIPSEDELAAEGGDLNDLISRLASGENIPNGELIVFASQLELDPDVLIQLRDRVKGKNGNGNGHPIGSRGD